MTTKTVAVTAIVFLAIYLSLRFLMPFVLPFVVGTLLAFLCQPIFRFLTDKCRFSRSGASMTIVLLMVALLVVMVSWMVTSVASEVSDLYAGLPQYYGEFNRVMQEILDFAGEVSEQLPEPLARAAQDQWNNLYSLVSSAVSGAGDVLRSLPTITANTVFTFLTVFFVLKDRDKMGAFLRTLMPSQAFAYFKNVETDMLGGLVGFARAQFVLILITMIINVLGLTALKSNYAVALGILLAVLDLLPIVGPGLIYVPWIVYHMLWGEPAYGLTLLVLYGGVSAARQVLQTHVVGKEMGLHPLVALLSLYAGVKLFGTAGLIYGPLTAILVKTLWKSGVIPHEGAST